MSAPFIAELSPVYCCLVPYLFCINMFLSYSLFVLYKIFPYHIPYLICTNISLSYSSYITLLLVSIVHCSSSTLKGGLQRRLYTEGNLKPILSKHLTHFTFQLLNWNVKRSKYTNEKRYSVNTKHWKPVMCVVFKESKDMTSLFWDKNRSDLFTGKW